MTIDTDSVNVVKGVGYAIDTDSVNVVKGAVVSENV